MFDPNHPVFAPLLLPADEAAVDECAPLAAAILSATVATNDRLRPLWRKVRDRAERLIVDPRTANLQFEGYMSMEDVRSLPYSPGQTTLGTLWQPAEFDRERRSEVIASVSALQKHLEADVLVAPYFLIPDPTHPWLEVAVDIAREARDAAAGRPLAVHACVDIDTILAAPARDAYGSAFRDTQADLFLLTVVNLDEREAPPDEVRAVLDLLAQLSGTAPTLLLHVGRLGLSAIASGAAGYSSGALTLEAYPRRYFREGLVSLPSDTHYLPGAMVTLPVRLATAVAECVAATDTAGAPPASRMVRRLRTRRALDAKAGEVQWLGAIPDGERHDALAARLEAAIELCTEAQGLLAERDGEQFTRSGFHYLEVLREISGGEQAELLGGAGF